jgi:hypothetical protein
MSRRLIICLLMMFVLQGVQASAESLPQAHMQQHCADHDSGQDCSCCSGAMSMAGCATLCSAGIAVSPAAMLIPHVASDGYQRLAVQGSSGPTYLPLNPPPIS